VSQVFLLRGAKQLLTLRGPSGPRRGTALHDLGIIEDGSVLIRDGRIAAVGATRRLENLKEARDAIEIPAAGNVVLPAFVDAALHVSLGPSNGSSEHKRKKLADFYDDTLVLLRACLQHGTLTADVKASGNPGGFHSDVSVLRQLASVGNQPVGVIPTWRISGPWLSNEPFSPELRETLHAIAARKLVHSVELMPQPRQLVQQELLAAMKEKNWLMKLNWLGGPADVLDELLRQLNPASVYCPSDLTPEECALLSRCPAAVVLAPGREIVTGGSGDAARSLLEQGAAIALGSGYDTAESPSFSMQMAIALAVLRSRLPVEVALAAATINAAHAVGCAAERGSIEYNKRADLLVLNLSDYREIPRRFGVNHVGMAIRDGNLVLNRTRWKIGAGRAVC
jgi:imidazolonepropionase